MTPEQLRQRRRDKEKLISDHIKEIERRKAFLEYEARQWGYMAEESRIAEEVRLEYSKTEKLKPNFVQRIKNIFTRG